MSSDSLILQLSEVGYREVAPRDMYGRHSELMSGEVSYDGGYREASPVEMFGEESTLGCSAVVEPLKPSLIAEPLFQGLVIGGIVAYLFVLYRFWGFVGQIWQGLFLHRSQRRVHDEVGELPFERFKTTVVLLGGVLLSLVLVRLVDIALVGPGVLLEHSVAMVAPLYGTAIMLAIFLWQYLLHKVVQWITRSTIMGEMGAVLVLNIVRCVVLLFPIVAIWLVAPHDMLSIWSIVLCVAMGLMVLIYLKETFTLFIGQKISILHWFLYLCTAILLPVSFLITIIPAYVG